VTSFLEAALVIVMFALIIVCLWIGIAILSSKRKLEGNLKVTSILFHLLMGSIYVVLYSLCITEISTVLPNISPVFAGLENTIQHATNLIHLFGLLLYVYLVLDLTFPSRGNLKFIPITILSILSGFSGALIIIILNQAVQGEPTEWIKYFLFSIFLSLYGGRIVRVKLTEITNRIVLIKRTSLIDKILNASYQKMEQVDRGNIRACLNNDTEMISQFANEAVSLIRNSVTLLVCLIYLATLNVSVLLLSLSVFAIAIACYYISGRKSGGDWNKNRDIQNHFYKYIDDLIYGFKELSMSRLRQTEFKKEIDQSCQDSYETKLRGEKRFINVALIGEVLSFVIMGMIIFVFPFLFTKLQPEHLISYLMIFLYITGQVNALLASVPHIIMMRISWNRINETTKQIEDITENEFFVEDNKTVDLNDVHLELCNVAYQYDNSEDAPFSIGPVNCDFRSVEIIFITGGNGSGKSTLAKLICGLYSPHEGEIKLNGTSVTHRYLRGQFTSIFSDFYLFDKLYGIPYEEKENELVKYLKLLQIDTKLTFENGRFSTLALSTGQKKRLALLVSYLEDKPIFLFDEWAADQDPEFRRFFYYELLPDLRSRGKCVIAITHDDNYFHVANRHLKMESGQMETENYLRIGVGS
jgi:putative ATP-binding cassette transporter